MQRSSSPVAAADPATSWALGASLALLAAALTGLLLGWLSGVRGVHGVYITFAMPVLIGSLIGWAAAMPARRLRFTERRPLVAAAVLGAVLCALAHHAFAFLSFSEAFARANPSDVMVDSLSDPVAAAILFFERATGETGYFAYLAFTGTMPAAEWSPVGLLGRLELGVGGTLAAAGAELALLIASATLSALLRTRALRRAIQALPLAPFALCDDAQLLALGDALDAGDQEAALRAIHGPTTAPTHALCLSPGGLAFHPLLPPAHPGDPLTVAPHPRATRAVPDGLLGALASPQAGSENDHAHP
jgi:hypothetical protein